MIDLLEFGKKQFPGREINIVDPPAKVVVCCKVPPLGTLQLYLCCYDFIDQTTGKKAFEYRVRVCPVCSKVHMCIVEES